MAPRKDTEQSDDWRNQAGQGGNNQQGQRENLTGGNQQSDRGRGSKQSDLGQGQRQGSRDDLEDEENINTGNRGNRGGRDQQR